MQEENPQGELDKVETTIGELVEAITEICLESGKSEEEGFRLASATIERILRRNRKHLTLH